MADESASSVPRDAVHDHANYNKKGAIAGDYHERTNHAPSPPRNETDHELPATVNAAVHRLLAMLPDDAKAEIAAKSRNQLIEQHFGLGTWIRNNFGLWQGNAALAKDAGSDHPDDIAGVIIEALWNHLWDAESRRRSNLPNASA